MLVQCLSRLKNSINNIYSYFRSWCYVENNCKLVVNLNYEVVLPESLNKVVLCTCRSVLNSIISYFRELRNLAKICTRESFVTNFFLVQNGLSYVVFCCCFQYSECF